jgi:hypothetical protein
MANSLKTTPFLDCQSDLFWQSRNEHELVGGAMFWLGIVHNKLHTLEKDVRELKHDTKKLTIRIESHILSVDAWKERWTTSRRLLLCQSWRVYPS